MLLAELLWDSTIKRQMLVLAKLGSPLYTTLAVLWADGSTFIDAMKTSKLQKPFDTAKSMETRLATQKKSVLVSSICTTIGTSLDG
jgi:hypothetical protein